MPPTSGEALAGDGTLAVLGAMPLELRRLARAQGLERATVSGTSGWQGNTSQGGRIVLVPVGVGVTAASRTTSRVLDEWQPSHVLVMGVAGAVEPGLEIAQVIAPSSVVDGARGTVYSPRFLLPEAGAHEAGAHEVVRTEQDWTLVTVHRFGDPVPSGASAVDMETAAIAAECERRGIPWGVRRAISDLPGTLSATVVALLGSDGRIDPGGLCRLVTHDPRQIRNLVVLGRDTSRAVASLSAAVAAELGAIAMASEPTSGRLRQRLRHPRR